MLITKGSSDDDKSDEVSVYNFEGLPADKSKTGGWLGAGLILGSELSERICVMGISMNMVTYLVGDLHLPSTKSANIVTNFLGTLNLLALLGGFLADAKLGRYLTVAISAAIAAMGVGLLTVAASIPTMRPPVCSDFRKRQHECITANGSQLALLYVALYTIALGGGGIKSNVSGFGSDQFDIRDPKERKAMVFFFNRFYFCVTLGSVFAVTVLVYIQDNVGRGWGYGISAATMVVAVVILIIGTPLYRYRKPQGSPFTVIWRVVCNAWKKRKVEYPSDARKLNGYDMAKVAHTERFRMNRRNNRGRGQAVPPPAAPVRFTKLCKDYVELGGTKFMGTETIIEAQQWLGDLERIFTCLEITNAQQRQLAAWQMKGAALNWWLSITAQTNEADLTWEQFREAFLAKWMPEAGKSQLYREFMDLKQGNMTFTEYERKFNELSQYGLNLIDTPLKLNEKFIAGARPEFYDRLITHVHGSFTALMDMALRYENPTSKATPAASSASAQSSGNSRKRKSNFYRNKKNRTQGLGSLSSSASSRPPVDLSTITCYRCDKKGHYASSCPTLGAAIPPPAQFARRDLCHICLQPGHFKKDCPTQKRGTTSGVFAVTSALPTAPQPAPAPAPDDSQA